MLIVIMMNWSLQYIICIVLDYNAIFFILVSLGLRWPESDWSLGRGDQGADEHAALWQP